MSKDGYLQTKVEELNRKIEELESKEKQLLMEYTKLDRFLKNEFNIVLENIECIKNTKQEIDGLPEKLFNFVRENLDDIIYAKMKKELEKVLKDLKGVFVTQSKINASEFNNKTKKYIRDNLSLEASVGTIFNILINKKITTMNDAIEMQKKYKRKVKPLVKKELGCSGVTTGELGVIDELIGTDFETDLLVKENKKVLDDNL